MDLIDIRRYLHQYPEISGEETQTQAYIVDQLTALGVDKIHTSFFETAVLAEVEGEKPGKTILFRAELDALPIVEQNPKIAYGSRHPGKAHLCGHDGHMTILLGLAQQLVSKRPLRGKVLLLFQPGEEDGMGAKGIVASGKLEEFKISYVFALHNVPKFPFGQVICKPGSFTPSVISLDIVLKGKTAHAGMPWAGVNPAQTIARLINYYQSLHCPDGDEQSYFLATPIHIDMGERAYGVSAGEGRLSYTFRAYDPQFFAHQKELLYEETQRIIAETEGLQSKLTWTQAFEANQNSSAAYQLVKKAASRLDFEFLEKKVGFSWGEDFGRFTQKYSGAMFGLGAGEEQPDLHNPDYDFPDQLIEPGIEIFRKITEILLDD